MDRSTLFPTVRGTFHQGDHRFSKSMGKQCVANSVIAIIYTNIVPLNEWETEDLDSILIAGNVLYKSINLPHDYLLISDIPNIIETFGKEYQIHNIKEIFGTLGNNNSEGIGESLEEAIMSMIGINENTNAVLCIGSGEATYGAGYACGIVVGMNDCYLFDPHSRNINGMPAEPGTSVLLHFNSPEQCCAHIQMLGYSIHGSQFEINIISITPLADSMSTKTDIQGNKDKYLEMRRAKKREYMRLKRQENSYQEKERLKNQEAKRLSRQSPTFKHREANARRHKRSDPKVKEQEATLKRQKRSDPKIKEQEVHAMRQKRSDPKVKEQEANAKRQKRSDPKVKEQEVHAMRQKRSDPKVKEQEANAKRQKRSDPKVKEQEAGAMRQKRRDPKVKEQEANLKRQKRCDLKVREQEASAMRQKRSNPRVKEQEANIKKQRRSDPKVREQEGAFIRCKRTDPIYREKEAKSMQLKRLLPSFKEREQYAKRQKRNNIEFKKKEAEDKRSTRSDPKVKEKERQKSNQRTNGCTLEDLLQIFNDSIAAGPIFVCTCCHQTWFRHSVYDVQNIRLSNKEEENMFKKCRTGYISKDNKEWICRACRIAVKERRVPKLSIYNKMGFPDVPPELDILPMEERLIALQIAFIQLRDHPICRQTFSKGNMVNVPVNISPTINTLPRNISETNTIAIKFKRKKQYKHCEFHENIRPLAVWKALNYLMQNSPLYKNANIQVDTTWLEKMRNFNDQQTICEGVGNLTVSSNNTNSSNHKGDNYSEVDLDEDENIISMDTMLDDYNPMPVDDDEPSALDELTFAPGEGQLPISVFKDDNAEYVTFPTIFCGQKRQVKRHVSVHYSDICKYELRCIDRRVASNVPNVFFKLKKLQMKQVFDKVTLAVRRYQTKGKKLKVKDVLNDCARQNLINLDEGYYIFRTIRNSPAYLEHRKKEAFAMIRQLGFPSLFISQSAAETKWPELLRALGQMLDKKNYTDKEIEEMDWNTKCRLLKGDSATVVRYFEHRFLQFFNLVVKSPYNPIHEVTDYFMRMEFAGRGTIHVHWFAYLKNAPVYEEDANDTVAAFYDKIISCSANVPSHHKKYIEYQLHRHSKTCRVGNTTKCRFGFPVPPMPCTLILEPLEFESDIDQLLYKNKWNKIQKHLKDYGMALDIDISFHEMLLELEMTEDDYIKAIQSSLIRPKLFLKRDPCEIRINNYMRNCLHFWRANHDIQLCISPYAMVQYMLSYVTKAQKGMSVVMDKACKEAKSGNMDLKKSVRHIGNAFLNGVETSQQEAAYLVLQMPVTRMSRSVIFVPTSHPDDRTFLMKDTETLKKMDPESDDIQANSIITEYQHRPTLLERYTLADFASELSIHYPKNVKFQDPYDDNFDDDPIDPYSKNIDTKIAQLSNGIVIKKRKVPRVLRYVNYNIKHDPENHYRERLLLFLPWRNELLDLYGEFGTYEEHYKVKEKQIVHIRKKYEQYNDHLQDALEEVEEDGTNDDGDSEEVHDSSIISRDEFGFFDPDRPEYHRQCDIAADLGITKNYMTEVDCIGANMTEREYLSLMQSLNKRQSELCAHIMMWIQTKKEPMHIFIEGGAGVGKTRVGKAIHQSMERFYCNEPGKNPDQMHCILLAPTGMAAYHLKGNTIHSGLHININRGKLVPLGHSEKNTLRSKLLEAKVVFIDEISMVGRRLWNKVNQRLQEIFGCNKVFGGLHVITIGDFYQMAPVLDSYVFKDDTTDYGPLATNLWNDYMLVYTLEEIMRQRGEKQFCETLNRLRLGQLTNSDNDFFISKTIKKTDLKYKSNVRHFFPLKETVRKHNEAIYTAVRTEKLNIHAYDYILGNQSENIKAKCALIIETNEKYAEIQGLERVLKAAVGLTYIVSVNINTQDGLINGAPCVLKKIHHITKSEIPSVLWVFFEDKDIGTFWRQRYNKFYNNSIDKTWTPIFAVDRQFKVRNGTVMRTQFPLKLASGTTIHKGQGSTFSKICLDMDISDSEGLAKNTNLAKIFLQHAHYVAASRVTTPEGLQILTWNPQLVSVNNDVKEHMEYLYSKKQLQICYTPVYEMTGLTCTFLNTRSLAKHFKSVQVNYNILYSDICFLAETRLTSNDASINYKIAGFPTIVRNDQEWNQTCRPPHGLLSYVKDKVRLLDVQKISSMTFESILTCVQDRAVPLPIQLAAVYVSPKCKYSYCIQKLQEMLSDIDPTCPIIILGDFNMKSIIGKQYRYNDKLEQHMLSKYNLKQVIHQETSNYASVIDLCFTNTEVQTTVIWNYWSDHRIVSVGLNI